MEFMSVCNTCTKCGEVYFTVSRKAAEKEVREFNRYYHSLSKEHQQDFYGGKKAKLLTYEKCWCGNSYKNFRRTKKGDCPDGVTLSPIIRKTD